MLMIRRRWITGTAIRGATFTAQHHVLGAILMVTGMAAVDTAGMMGVMMINLYLLIIIF